MQEERSYLSGYVDCYVTPEGKVYKGGREKAPIQKEGHAPKIRLQENNRTREYGLATLVARAFVANPHGFTKIIFKDGDNTHCTAQNIAWVSHKEFSRYSLFKGKPLELPLRREEAEERKKEGKEKCVRKVAKTALLLPPEWIGARAVPGTTGYFVTQKGDVYSGERKLKPIAYPNRAACVKVKRTDGKRVKQTIATLVALAFLPNPEHYKRVIFKDRNKNNPALDNLCWVSEWQYRSFYRSKTQDLLGPPKYSKRKALLAERHPQSKPIEGFPPYFIAPDGVVYKGRRLIQPRKRGGKALQVCLRVAGGEPKQYRTLGLARLVALHFVPNPHNLPYIIFKDRNNQNCHRDNIAWVDGETFALYSGLLRKGGRRKKIVLTRQEAVEKCQHPLLLSYYKTGDAGWIDAIWQEIEKKLGMLGDWKHHRSECYLYFRDRMERYSILKDPVGLLRCYLKGLRSKLRKEINFDMPMRAVLQTDESLRNLRCRDGYDKWQ